MFVRKGIIKSYYLFFSASETFDATFPTNVVVTSEGMCTYIPPGKYVGVFSLVNIEDTSLWLAGLKSEYPPRHCPHVARAGELCRPGMGDCAKYWQDCTKLAHSEQLWRLLRKNWKLYISDYPGMWTESREPRAGAGKWISQSNRWTPTLLT